MTSLLLMNGPNGLAELKMITLTRLYIAAIDNTNTEVTAYGDCPFIVVQGHGRHEVFTDIILIVAREFRELRDRMLRHI